MTHRDAESIQHAIWEKERQEKYEAEETRRKIEAEAEKTRNAIREAQTSQNPERSSSGPLFTKEQILSFVKTVTIIIGTTGLFSAAALFGSNTFGWPEEYFHYAGFIGLFASTIVLYVKHLIKKYREDGSIGFLPIIILVNIVILIVRVLSNK